MIYYYLFLNVKDSTLHAPIQSKAAVRAASVFMENTIYWQVQA